MSYINYNNGAQAGFQNALAMGMSMGAQAREAKERKEYRNALATVIGPQGDVSTQTPGIGDGDPRLPQNSPAPDRNAAMAVLAERNPQLYMQLQEREQARASAQQEAQLTQAAMSDDPAAREQAMGQLATVNFPRWKELDSQQKAAIEQEAKRNANAAIDVLNMPPEQWSQAIMGYANRYGDPEIAAIADMPIDQQRAALRAAVAEGEMTEKLISMERPDYRAFGFDETLVNVRDPAAVAQFGVTANGGQANIPPPPPGFTLDGDGAGNSTGGF